MSQKFILGSADYVILALMLVVSAGIGVYFRIFGGKQKTNKEYLFAGKNMPISPVAFSLMATFMSAITIMGIPAEMYLYGTHMTFMVIGFIVGPIFTSYVFLPIYFDTGVSTAYEYLERRFGKTTRRLLSGIFLFQYAMYNGVILYGPAIALSAVTDISTWTSVISIGMVCTFYCTLGGMKAVLWTDVFQSFLMYICIAAIIVKGCMDLGGINSVFKIAYEGGRIVSPTFELDFSTRYTIYSLFFQSLIHTVCSYGGSQVQVQRQLTLKNLKSAKIASLISALMLTVFHLLCCFCGLIFYAQFKTCDPMTSPTKPIHFADQLMPYYITSTMNQYPGLPGLCIAGIFSASLSSVSSGVNSMAAVTYEDIIGPLWRKPSKSVFITKIASVFYGILSILISFLVASMGNLYKASLLVTGMVSGTSLGVFLLAALTTTTTETGANLGMIAGFLLAGCITFIPNSRYYPQLPVGKTCSPPTVNMFNDTMLDNNFDSSQYAPGRYSSLSTTTVTSTVQSATLDNFPISFMWISSISLLVSVVVGYSGSWIFSYVTGKSRNVPVILLSPVRRYFLPKESLREEPRKEEIVLLSHTDTTIR